MLGCAAHQYRMFSLTHALTTRGWHELDNMGGIWSLNAMCGDENEQSSAVRCTGLRITVIIGIQSKFNRTVSFDQPVNVHNEEQPYARLVRPLGNLIDVIEEQPVKAPPQMIMRPAGSSIDINCRCKAKDGAGWQLGRPENAVIEAGRQRDRSQRRAAKEGVRTEAHEAGGQLDQRQRGAVIEGAPTKAREASGQRDRRQ